jgi:hypothetical protein
MPTIDVFDPPMCCSTGVCGPEADDTLVAFSGACTTEIAAFDKFTQFLADSEATAPYDHIEFDTAPTGHTLLLLDTTGSYHREVLRARFDAFWSDLIDDSSAPTC